MNESKILQIESLSHMSFDDVLSLYRQGYKLEELTKYNEINYLVRNVGDVGRYHVEKDKIIGLDTCKGSPCPCTVRPGTMLTLTAGVTSGTAPYTYHWSITKPDGTTETLANQVSNQYTFAVDGSYTVSIYTTDSCASGAKTSNTDSCTITVSAVAPPPTGCTGCDLTKSYCLVGQCVPKKYVLFGGLGIVALIILAT